MSHEPHDTKDAPRRGSEAWKDATKGIDRIISVSLSLERPRPVSWVAEQSHVSESTTREHLDRLVELGILTAAEASGVKTYAPDPAYTKYNEISRLTRTYSRDELSGRVTDLKESIEDCQQEYGVDSPGELRVRAAEHETTASAASEYREVAAEWETLEYRLSLHEAALREYDEFDRGQQQTHA